MEFRLLGPVEVVHDGSSLAIGGRKSRRLLAGLLLNPGVAVPATRLIDLVWGDHPPASVHNSLQVHVSALRKTLREADATDRLVHDVGGYRLDVRDGELDVAQFDRLVEQARDALRRGASAQARDLFERALKLWRGTALQGTADGELITAATGLEHRRVQATQLYAQVLLDAGDAAHALQVLGDATAVHPLDETLHGLTMLALDALGRAPQASVLYHDFAKRLRDELGVSPSPAVRRIHEDILLQRTPATDTEPVEEGAPKEMTTFVGRAGELAELRRLLESSRIVTVVGPGGAGKTRLARRLFDAMVGEKSTWWVDAAALTSDEQLPRAVASALGVVGATTSTLDVVIQHLSDKAGVLALDNCEHLLPAARALGAALADACPDVRLLATSRVPLDMEGETAWRLPGLLAPQPGLHFDTERVRRYEAVRLFTERARATQPDFVVDDANAAHVAAICARLEGLPLGIELAAAALRRLTVEQLARELDVVLGLVAPPTVARDRQEPTLRHTLEWSYRQLDEGAARIFAELSVFVGGFTSQAVAEVCRLADATPVLEQLRWGSLVDADPAAGDRYRFHELVRQFATERLAAAGTQAEVRHRHVRWVAELAQTSREKVDRDGVVEWFTRAPAELGNIRAALAAAAELDDRSSVARIVDGVWYAFAADAGDEVMEWLAPYLQDDAVEGLEPDLALRLVHAAAMMRMRRRWDLDALPALERALDAARNAGDVDLELETAANMGALLAVNGDPRGVPLLRETAARAAATGSPAEHECLYVYGLMAHHAGHPDEAVTASRRAIERAGPVGDEDTAAAAHEVIVADLIERGELDHAWQLANDVLQRLRRVNDPSGTADILSHIATIALRRGELDDAQHVLVEAVRLGLHTNPVTEVPVLTRTVITFEAAGNPEEALFADGYLEALVERFCFPVPVPLRHAHEAAVVRARESVGGREAERWHARGKAARGEDLLRVLAPTPI